MYLALYGGTGQCVQWAVGRGGPLPFRRTPLLLDLGENAVGLVVDAVGAGGQFPVALDLLFAAHVAGLFAVPVSHAEPCLAQTWALTLAILRRFASLSSPSRAEGSKPMCRSCGSTGRPSCM